MTTRISSQRYAVEDFHQALELCYSRGWTDGLPVVPPTEPAVRGMLEAVGLEPDAQVAFITNRQAALSAEKVAINAVMAGCLPEHMPVVLAAVEGIADPRWGYHGPATSTGGAGVLMIVNGPIARRLDFNCGDNLFGPGWRSNATVGRAVRLVMRNVIGTIPGRLDRGTVGHPGKYTYVIAENEAESPWTPLHAERGCRPEDSAVTVMAALGPHQFYNQLSSTPRVSWGPCATPCATRHGGPAELLRGAGGRAHADHRGGRLVQVRHPQVRLREHHEHDRPSQADGAAARRDQARGRDRDPAPGADPGRYPGGGGGGPRRLVLVLYPGLGEPDLVAGGDHGDQREENMMAGFEILDPTVEPRRQPLTYVARPDSLKGKRIGLVENTKYNSDKRW